MRSPLFLVSLLLFAPLASQAAPLPWVVPIRLKSVKQLPNFALLSSNQSGAAIQNATEYVKQVPDQAGAFHFLAEALRKGSRFDEALQAVARSFEIAPGNATSFELRGKIYFDQKRYDESEKDVAEAMRLLPGESRLPFLMGLTHWWQGHLVKAGDSFEQSLKLNPNQPYVWAVLASARFFLGQAERALDAADKAFGGTQKIYVGLQGIRDTQVYLQKTTGLIAGVFPASPAAEAGLQEGDQILAIDGRRVNRMSSQEILDAVEKGPAGSEVKLRIKPKNSRRNREVTLQRIQGTDAQNLESAADALVVRALVFRLQDKRLQGQKVLQQAQKILPGNWDLGAAEVRFDLDFRKDPKALLTTIEGLFSKLPEMNPMREATLFLCMAETLARLGRIDEAVEALLEARNTGMLRPTYVSIWEDCQKLLRELGATAWVSEAHSRLAAKDPGALKLLRRARAVLLDQAEERKLLLHTFAWAKALGLRASDEAVRFSRRAQILFQDKDFAAAAIELNKALDACPFDPGLYCNGAFIMAELRRYSEAIRLMNVYLAAAPGAADAQANRNRVIGWELDLERGKGR